MKPSQPSSVTRGRQARKIHTKMVDLVNRVKHSAPSRELNADGQMEKGNRDGEYAGQKLRLDKKNHTRLLLSNIGGLIGEKIEEKNASLKRISLKYNLDMIAITEMGQNEKRLDHSEKLKELTRGWFENIATRTAYNRHFDSQKKRQYGGVGLIATNDMANRIQSSSSDTTGLGRWTSILIQGKAGCKTRVISAYRPCNGNSEASVQIQQNIHFADPSVQPRIQFFEDLATQIDLWIHDGEQIILAGDINITYSLDGKPEKEWLSFLERTGLIDVHKTHLTQVTWPNTHNRGRFPIDIILCSPTIRIKRCGYLPFDKIPSDHRAIWVDFDTKDILGLNPDPPLKFEARRLKSIDPRIVKRYLDYIIKAATNENLITDIDALALIPKEEWTEMNNQKYESISQTYRSIMVQAEKNCRHIYKGYHPWSPTFDKARKTKFLWEMIVKQLQGVSISIRKLLKYKKQLGIKHTKCTLPKAMEKLAQAKGQYKKIKRQSKTLRQTYLESLVTAISEEKQTNRSSELKAMQDREQLRETYRKISAVRNKNMKKALVEVQLRHATSGEIKRITDKKRMEQAIIQNNKQKYQQTKGQCPLTKGTLLQHLGYLADTQASDEILTGEYILPRKCRRTVKRFLKACKIPMNFSPHPFDQLTQEQYKNGWASVNERTSSGQVHYGHWKVGAKHPIIGRMEWLMSILPFRHGFSPKIWHKATDVMIMKASGKTDLESLRTIVLYEADFNFMNKRLGRQATDNAAHNNEMAIEQFAKKGTSCIDQCLNRRLVFDLVRFARASFSMCSSDLVSCYDRIVHSAAVLAMRRFGISKEEAKTMFLTIQECKHKVRTGLGDSNDTYGGIESNEEPLMGVGQGNGAGPAIWAIISCVLFMAMHAEGLNCTFASKLSKDIIKIVGFMYVDDMDLIKIRPGFEHIHIAEDLQLALDYWNKLVRVTGGGIRIDKSKWYGYYHKWDEEAGTYTMTDLVDTNITARDTANVTHNLEQIPFRESTEMVGHIMNPTGTSDHQVEKLLQISKEESTVLRHGSLRCHESKLALTHTIIPKLRYPLTATSITEAQARAILRPSLEISLQKMGMIKTMGYDYVHGSLELQGLGIPNLYHYAYSSQIEQFINHQWLRTQTGTFMKMEIEEFLLELGTGFGIFDGTCPDRILDGLLTENTWIQSLRDYTRHYNISFRMPSINIQPQRQGDHFLMDLLSTLPTKRLSRLEMKNFNRCRIYKRVRFLSDIRDGEGSSVASRSYLRLPFFRNNDVEYNPHECPNDKQWKAWEKGLKLLQEIYPTPLGEWTIKHKEITLWDFFLDPGHSRLLQRVKDRWIQYELKSRRWIGKLIFNLTGTSTEAPITLDCLVRTTVKITNYEIITEQDAPRMNTRPNEDNDTLPCDTDEDLATTPVSLISYLRSEKGIFEDSSWTLKDIELIGDPSVIIDDFIEGKVLLVGDGSFQPKVKYGANASILSSADGTNYIIARGPTAGNSDTQSAYRSELGAVLGCSILRYLLTKYTNTNPDIGLACDNETALHRTFLPKSIVRCKWANSDLISATMDIWDKAPGKIITYEVEGHADEKRSHDQLTILEKLNCIADKEAKKAMSERPLHCIMRNSSGKSGMMTVIIDGIHITDNPAQVIQQHISRKRMIEAGIRLKRFTEGTFSLIDENALGKSMKKMAIHRQIFVTKWISKQLPVGKRLKQRRQSLYDTCPVCQNEIEDVEHLYHCQQEEAMSLFDKYMDEFSDTLEKWNTHTEISTYLPEILKHWRRNGKVPSHLFPSSITKKHIFMAFGDQARIGWKQFMEGLISKEWAKLQQLHYDTLDTKLTGDIWASKLITYLWEVNHKIWTNRNDKLHTLDTAQEELYAGSHLHEAIIHEYCTGLNGLHGNFSSLFLKQTVDELLSKGLQDRLKWFRTIRMAREASKTDRRDVFSEKGPLRKWAGIT